MAEEQRRLLGIPDHPTWKQFFAILAITFMLVVGGLAVIRGMRHEIDTLSETVERGGRILEVLEDGLGALQANADASRERGFATRAQNCMTLILDNDRYFSLTPACTTPEITAYYPLNLCSEMFSDIPECGTKVTSPAL